MEWFDSVINILGLLFGGSVISIVTWRFARRKAESEAKKAEAEAKQAEAEAAEARQDYYQQMMDDLAKDRDYYKTERNELRSRLDDTDDKLRDLQRDVARNGRMVEAMRPFICTDLACKARKRALISADGEIKETAKTKTNGNQTE